MGSRCLGTCMQFVKFFHIAFVWLVGYPITVASQDSPINS